MALFDFVENFFFISLGITFALILLLVYHFKQRISSMERKGDTMFELLSNVVKEMQCMKGINSYYKSLFYSSTCVEQQPVCAYSLPVMQKSEPEKKVIDLTVSNDAFDVNPNVQVVKHTEHKMIVSDDDTEDDDEMVSSEDDSSCTETSDGSDLDDDENGSDDEEDDTVVSFDEMKYTDLQNNIDTLELSANNEIQFETLQLPVEVRDTLDDLTDTVEIMAEPVVVVANEPDVVSDSILEIPTENVTPSFPEVVSENVESEVVAEAVQPPTPGPSKEQKRDMYFKMNITQLKSLATVAGIQQDISKMKKKELISLLESLDE
jgi:hypothetical protein